MKKTFLTTCMAFLFLAATAQENPYIVKTRGAKKKAQTQMEGGQLGMQEEDEAARDFISQNFRYPCCFQRGCPRFALSHRIVRECRSIPKHQV